MAQKMEKVKKRKRHTDGPSNPSKRIAIESGKQIKVAFHEAEKWAPIIGNCRSAPLVSQRDVKS